MSGASRGEAVDDVYPIVTDGKTQRASITALNVGVVTFRYYSTGRVRVREDDVRFTGGSDVPGDSAVGREPLDAAPPAGECDPDLGHRIVRIVANPTLTYEFRYHFTEYIAAPSVTQRHATAIISHLTVNRTRGSLMAGVSVSSRRYSSRYDFPSA
jgi:hypothetical protein